MKTIDELAYDFISAYNSGNEELISSKADVFVKSIKKHEWQFKKVQHTYVIARSMYYLLKANTKLSADDRKSIIILIYYCLLKNYLDNIDVESSDTKYSNFIGGCELAFVIMCYSGQFLMQGVLFELLGYMPNFAEKHIIDQMFLFGGIVKDANEKGYHYFLDTDISRRFNSLMQEVYENIPSGEALQVYKNSCTSMINDISKKLEYNLRNEDDYEF